MGGDEMEMEMETLNPPAAKKGPIIMLDNDKDGGSNGGGNRSNGKTNQGKLQTALLLLEHVWHTIQRSGAWAKVVQLATLVQMYSELYPRVSQGIGFILFLLVFKNAEDTKRSKHFSASSSSLL